VFGCAGYFGYLPDQSDSRDWTFDDFKPAAGTVSAGFRSNALGPKPATGSALVAQRYRNALRWAFPATDPRNLSSKNDSLILSTPPTPLPAWVDLRPFMGPVEDQGPLQSCTANAVMGAIDYLQIAQRGEYIDGSRLFLYKATRDLLQWAGDAGAYIRSTIKALALVGCCPEDYYPYDPAAVDAQPTAFCYSIARWFEAIAYYRLNNLEQIRRCLAQGYPVAFGFTCYESLDTPPVAASGVIPYPVPEERTIGGHAVLAVGYIDAPAKSEAGKGAAGYLIIRNSWGPSWGVDGYGLLPYDYIIGNGLAAPLSDDYWTVTLAGSAAVSGRRAAPYTMTDWPSRPDGPV
jgi:C1A family cysteine protease